jgi:hypothetical protein
VDPVPEPLVLRKSGSAGNRIQISGSVARSSDHKTTEAVRLFFVAIQNAKVINIVYFQIAKKNFH